MIEAELVVLLISVIAAFISGIILGLFLYV
ncbi:hypothetical protein vBKpnMJEC_0229 [Klebsiella phage vB_KpnM-JEC]|nr:hypothetical protein vBKpnMJEC_0229 [Klebsiella phage vB_KpnM-JEC]